MEEYIFIAYAGIWGIAAFLVFYFLIKRLKREKTEDFEKRDN